MSDHDADPTHAMRVLSDDELEGAAGGADAVYTAKEGNTYVSGEGPSSWDQPHMGPFGGKTWQSGKMMDTP